MLNTQLNPFMLPTTHVEVVALWQNVQSIKQVPWQSNLTVEQAVMNSGILQELNLTWPVAVGVFSKKVKSPNSTLLQPNDRVEMYRPLIVDPKTTRAMRADAYPVGRKKPLKK